VSIKIIQTSDGPKLHDGKNLVGSLPTKPRAPKAAKAVKSKDSKDSLTSTSETDLAQSDSIAKAAKKFEEDKKSKFATATVLSARALRFEKNKLEALKLSLDVESLEQIPDEWIEFVDACLNEAAQMYKQERRHGNEWHCFCGFNYANKETSLKYPEMNKFVELYAELRKDYNITPGEQETLEKWIGKMGREMNSLIRSNRILPFSDTYKRMEALDSIIAKVPQSEENLTLYRSFDLREVLRLKVGDVYCDPGYMSTTLLNLDKEENQKLRGHLVTIEGTARAVGKINSNGDNSGIVVQAALKKQGMFWDEAEFLLPRGTAIRYMGVENNPDGRFTLNFDRV